MTETKMFANAIEFSKFIESQAIEHEMDILEFLSFYVVSNSIDEETIPALLTPSIKEKIEAEARKRYIMPKKTTSEIDL